MPKGGTTKTTWKPAWKSGKTTVIRVPEVLAERLMKLARAMDDGEACNVTGNMETSREAADTYLMTISPKERRSAKRLLYGFLKSLGHRHKEEGPKRSPCINSSFATHTSPSFPGQKKHHQQYENAGASYCSG